MIAPVGVGDVTVSHGPAFEAAWARFAGECADAVAPEATFQAWFAHYLMECFGRARVAREPIFKHRHIDSPWRAMVPGGEVKLDVVTLRTAGVPLGHYVSRPEPEGTGLAVLGRLAAISELKVASTTVGGLTHRSVAQDIHKLSMLLDVAATYGITAPVAYACVLDNHPTRRYSWRGLEQQLRRLPPHVGVRLLTHPEPGAIDPSSTPILHAMLGVTPPLAEGGGGGTTPGPVQRRPR